MRLSIHTDYSLRVLMLLALEPTERHTIVQIAQRYGISRDHLMKVVQTLVHAGFVLSTRGRGGGVALARSAGEIRVGDVVRATEPDFALVECFTPEQSQCVIRPACALRGALLGAQQAFLASLDAVTLAELVGPASLRRSMHNLLSVAGPSGLHRRQAAATSRVPHKERSVQ